MSVLQVVPNRVPSASPRGSIPNCLLAALALLQFAAACLPSPPPQDGPVDPKHELGALWAGLIAEPGAAKVQVLTTAEGTLRTENCTCSNAKLSSVVVQSSFVASSLPGHTINLFASDPDLQVQVSYLVSAYRLTPPASFDLSSGESVELTLILDSHLPAQPSSVGEDAWEIATELNSDSVSDFAATSQAALEAGIQDDPACTCG